VGERPRYPNLRPWRAGQSGNPSGPRSFEALLREVGMGENERAEPGEPDAKTRGSGPIPTARETNVLAVGYVDRRGHALIPRVVLHSLATKIRLSSSEWRVLALVLATSGPVKVFAMARDLRLPYSNTKRTTRALLRWHMLERSPGGVRFQPDWTQWQPAPNGVPPPERRA
jgi:hypothetical protein